MSASITEDRNAKATGLVRFGNFELDPLTQELRRNGIRVRLQYKPYQVLISLLENPGDIVTREELRNRLWPADTYVDFDTSLNTAVNRLRQTLGDDADNPRFIETLARRGYRFIAPLQWVPAGEAQPVSSGRGALVEGQGFLAKLLVVAVFLMLFLMLTHLLHF